MSTRKLTTKEGLTEKELRFVDAYLGPADRVAWKAAQMSGSKAKGLNALAVTADRLLNSVKVKEEIRRRFEKERMGRDEVVAMLAKQARVSILDFVRIDKDTGIAVLDLRKAKKQRKGGLIRKFKPIVDRDGNTVAASIETVDSQKALHLIARIQGYVLDAPTEDQDDGDDLPPVASPEAQAVYQSYLESLGEKGPDEPASK